MPPPSQKQELRTTRCWCWRQVHRRAGPRPRCAEATSAGWPLATLSSGGPAFVWGTSLGPPWARRVQALPVLSSRPLLGGVPLWPIELAGRLTPHGVPPRSSEKPVTRFPVRTW